jgi:HK97 family phage prohead protease
MSAVKPDRRSEQKFVDLVLDELEPGGSFSGYASLFGRVDLGHDVIEPGAFTRSLRTRGAAGIRMLFQHDPNQPIGAWTELREDKHGLFVRGRLTEGVARSQEVLNLIRGGALDGLSIGFRAVKAKTDSATGVRRIIEADLWEISVVTFPMMPEARVERVKGFGWRRTLPTTREFERWLTQDAGLTRRDARTVISKGFAKLANERDATRSTQNNLVETIRRATRMINGKDIL